MKFPFLRKWAAIGFFSLAVTSGVIQNGKAQQNGYQSTFFCGNDEGKPATIARASQEDGSLALKTLIIWETFAIENYPPAKRCSIVSQKFEDNMNSGDLEYIVSGTANTWPVLCASRTNNDYIMDCPDPNILMTLLPGDDSQAMIEKIVAINNGYSTTPARHTPNPLFDKGNLKAIHVKTWILSSLETREMRKNTQENNQCTKIWGCK